MENEIEKILNTIEEIKASPDTKSRLLPSNAAKIDYQKVRLCNLLLAERQKLQFGQSTYRELADKMNLEIASANARIALLESDNLELRGRLSDGREYLMGVDSSGFDSGDALESLGYTSTGGRL